MSRCTWQREKAVALVFGGFGAGSMQRARLCDVQLLDFESLTWTAVKVAGRVPVARTQQCSVPLGPHDSAVLVCGGRLGPLAVVSEESECCRLFNCDEAK